ncbi:MAG: saccharopine dehydrogenase NADP-binding domain-containing protein [Polyangiales bacterium]
MHPTILLYGAYGYTGRLVARLAKEKGIPVRLAGRDPAKLEELSRETGHPFAAFGLDDPAALANALRGHAVVLHCAGPFEHTYRAMAEACFAAGVHYLDITGEISVFEGLAALDARAKAAGVMLLPGAGFDVVPSDCLAAHLARRLPTATRLSLAFRGLGGGVSHGTATTMVENLHRGGQVRRDGKLVDVPTAHLARTIRFSGGEQSCATIPWGDVSTAFHSTGIPDIEVVTGFPKGAVTFLRLTRPFSGLLGAGWVQRRLKRAIDARPAGPSDAQRAAAKSELWGEAKDPSGARVEATLDTPEGYTLTAMASLEIARRVAAGEAKPGFQTPSRAFGADFVLGFPGVTRTDVV